MVSGLPANDAGNQVTRESLSVALCTYNGESFVEMQLASILSQTTPVDELIVRDDNSSDGTVNAVLRVLKEGKIPPASVKITENAINVGPRKNFEDTLSLATGDIIFLSDQDDVWNADRTSAYLTEFQENPNTLAIFSDATVVDQNGVLTGKTIFGLLGLTRRERNSVSESNGILKALLRRNIVTGATMAVRKELLSLASPFPQHWLHDEWLAIVAASHGQLKFLSGVHMSYRVHTGNAVGFKSVGLRYNLGRMFFSRAARNKELFIRAEELCEHPFLEFISAQTRNQIREKAAHEIVRSSLPKARFARLAPVFKELLTGRYHRVERGLSDAIRDLVQPA